VTAPVAVVIELDAGEVDLSALVPLLLYDGRCGLCDRSVRFAFRHDVRGVIRAAPLDGETAARVRAHFAGATFGDTVILVDRDPRTGALRWYERSDAVIGALRHLDGPWPAFGALLALIPRVLRDLAYRAVARVRRRVFGTVDACALPPAEWRTRLLP
jgi:predicted DCC family thiol-disulfide oxidoreductase YuxK